MGSEIQVSLDKKRVRPKQSEVMRLWCDNQKIQHLTKFKPEYDIDTGLEETISWFLDADNLSKYKADIYNI